jgi:hypothetical protein
VEDPSEVSSPQAQPQAPRHEWGLRDLFRAVPLSFDLEKILTGAAGLFLSAFVFGNVYWLGLLTGERAALRVFSIIGIILASTVWVVFSGIIAKMSLTQLLENRKTTSTEIKEFLRERWTTLVGTPIAFGGLSLLFLMVLGALEVIGAVPGIGPIIFAASFLLAFFLAFMAALTAVVHALGAFLYPSIVALKGAGATSVMMEMFELVRRKGLHLLLYEVIIGAVGILMTTILGFVAWAGLYITNWSALAIMKEKFSLSLSGVPRVFRVFLQPFEQWLPAVPAPTDVAWHYDLAGFILGFSLLWIVIATAVYPFVFFNTAGSITYLVLSSEDEADGPEA